MGQSRKRALIGLKQSEAKFNRAKRDHDGSDLAEARYQKAKRQLRDARQLMRSFPPVIVPNSGDATAAPSSLHTAIRKG